MNKLGLISLLVLLTLPVAAGEIKLATQKEGHKLSAASEPYEVCYGYDQPSGLR